MECTNEEQEEENERRGVAQESDDFAEWEATDNNKASVG